MRTSALPFLAAVCLLEFAHGVACGQAKPRAVAVEEIVGPRLPMAVKPEPLDGTSRHESKGADTVKTMGGAQFWGDVAFFHKWRIQQNVFTKHYRLLDEHDHRHMWGSLADCRKKLDEIRNEKKLPPMKGRGVVLLHGILRTAKCMSSFAEALEKDGYSTFAFNYPSTQVGIPDDAEYLHQAIESLEGIDEVSIIAHSMGGLVTRAYFEKHHDPRIKRVVMLGTPNRGAELADFLYRSSFIRAAAGPGGRQLVTADDGLLPKLPAPKCEFAIIAGAKSDPSGWNPLIPGDDDGTVTVESTKLAGASDFSTVNALHGHLLGSDESIEMAMRFLKEGHLREDRPAQPITSASDADVKPMPKAQP